MVLILICFQTARPGLRYQEYNYEFLDRIGRLFFLLSAVPGQSPVLELMRLINTVHVIILDLIKEHSKICWWFH